MIIIVVPRMAKFLAGCSNILKNIRLCGLRLHVQASAKEESLGRALIPGWPSFLVPAIWPPSESLDSNNHELLRTSTTCSQVLGSMQLQKP